ncbi:MAG: helix-turn-helix domain-containing protein, partial [Anaerolineales bacterium]
MARHTTLEERLQIIEWKQYGLPTTQIVQRTGWQPSTIRKWLARVQFLANCSGRQYRHSENFSYIE